MRRALLVLLCLIPTFSYANYVRVDRNASVYESPSSKSTVLEHLKPGDSDKPIYLVTASDRLQNGYFKVYLYQGAGVGWIYKSRVREFSGNPPETERTDVYGGFPDTSKIGDKVEVFKNVGYVIAYSETKNDPLWSAYRLGKDQGYKCNRLARFRTDNRTEDKITHDEYSNQGYDRGHMAPSHNIGSRYGCTAQDETYFMSNIAPQIPTLNQRPWGGLENLVATYPENFGQVWVITGPIFDPVWLNRLCSGIEIPVAFFKIIIRKNNGVPDVLATIFGQDTPPGAKLSTLVTTVDEIEKRTGIDFFTELPAALQNSIESRKATDPAWQLSTPLDTNFRPKRRETCTMEPVRRDEMVE